MVFHGWLMSKSTRQYHVYGIYESEQLNITLKRLADELIA